MIFKQDLFIKEIMLWKEHCIRVLGLPQQNLTDWMDSAPGFLSLALEARNRTSMCRQA